MGRWVKEKTLSSCDLGCLGRCVALFASYRGQRWSPDLTLGTKCGEGCPEVVT